MNTHTEKAAEFFLSGCGCAQAVLAAFTDVTGLDESTALRLASSFGGGMGRMREVCGACSAMFMVAGLLYGDYDPTDVKAKSTHYALIQRLGHAAQGGVQAGAVAAGSKDAYTFFHTF